MKFLQNQNSAIRYWGATGILILKNDAVSAISALKEATKDKSGPVATLAAEALYGLDNKQIAIETFKRILTSKDYDVYDKIFALNSIDTININTPELNELLAPLSKYTSTNMAMDRYVIQNATYLMGKNQVKP